MNENKFKKRVFRLIVITKIIVFAVLLFCWNRRGFSTKELCASIAVIVPIFTTYIGFMMNDFLGDSPYISEEKDERQDRLIKRSYVMTTRVLIPFLAFIITFAIYQKVSGVWSFELMQSVIAGTEAALGGYIGKVIFSVFKKQE